MRPTGSSPPRCVRYKLSLLQTIILINALIYLCLFFFGDLSVNVCANRKSAHEHLVQTLSFLHLQHNRSSLQSRLFIPEAEHFFSHASLRTISSTFLAIENLPESRKCHPLRFYDASLEWSAVARYPTDGILLYLLHRLGSSTKRIIEIDSARGNGIYAATGALTFLHGFDLLSIHETWSGYSSAYSTYEKLKHWPEATRTIIEASSIPTTSASGTLTKITRREGFTGTIDFLALFAGSGHDIEILKSLHLTPVNPRIIALFYQDYWGPYEQKFRIADGISDAVDLHRERLLTGGSIAAIVKLAHRRNFKLIWCARTSPIAILVNLEDANRARLHEISTEKCLNARKKTTGWSQDAEAQWDLAQTVKWETL